MTVDVVHENAFIFCGVRKHYERNLILYVPHNELYMLAMTSIEQMLLCGHHTLKLYYSLILCKGPRMC